VIVKMEMPSGAPGTKFHWPVAGLYVPGPEEERYCKPDGNTSATTAAVAVAGPKLVTVNWNESTSPTFAAWVLAVLPMARSVVLVPIVACKSSGAISTRLTTEPRKIRLVFIINQGCVLLPDSMPLPD
jgi:hypothetical protein